MVPSFTLRESGSKSHFGSGFGVAASANKVENGVENPRAMFLQKSAPTAVGALNVAGSHSSSATTCAILVGASGCIAAASTRQEMTKPSFIRVRFIAFSFSEFQNFQRTVWPKAAVLGVPQRLTDGPSAKRDRATEGCSLTPLFEVLLLCNLHWHSLRRLRIQRLAFALGQSVEDQRASQLWQIHRAHLAIRA